MSDASLVRHACSFHRNGEEQLTVAVPFVEQGLRRAERCIIVSDEPERWKPGLLTSMDAPAGREDDLNLWPSSAWRPPGRLTSLSMAAHVWAMIERSQQGYPGIRIVLDMSWTLVDEPPAAALCHLEATLDLLYSPDLPVQVLCQFDGLRMPVAVLHAALRTHPYVWAGERFLPNLYYEAPAILANEPDLNECSTDPVLVGGMLSRFVALT